MNDFRFAQLADSLEGQIRSNRLLDLSVPWADEVIFPAYHGLSLMNVIHSLAETLNAPFVDSNPLANSVWGNEQPQDIERVVLFLLDGTGYMHLQQVMQDEPEIAQLVADITDNRGMVPLTTVAPSTTAVALTTLWTGGTPGQTAIPGTIVYMRELSMPINVLFSRPETGRHPNGILETWGINSGEFVQRRGLAEHLSDYDIPTHFVLHRQLVGSGLSQILHRGDPTAHMHIGYSDIYMRFHQVMRQTAGKRAFVNMYIPSVDSMAHAYGAHNVYTTTEIKNQLTAIRDVLNDKTVHDGKTLFMLLADHGHYDAPQTINLGDDRFAGVYDDMLIAMTGDARLGHLYLREGSRKAVKEVIDNYFEERMTYIDTEAAFAAGLYGPVTREAKRRMGDLILVPRRGHIVQDPTMPELPLISWHGGLDEWEMLIPFMWRVL